MRMIDRIPLAKRLPLIKEAKQIVSAESVYPYTLDQWTEAYMVTDTNGRYWAIIPTDTEAYWLVSNQDGETVRCTVQSLREWYDTLSVAHIDYPDYCKVWTIAD